MSTSTSGSSVTDPPESVTSGSVRAAEVAPTLDGPVPRSLGFLDQGAFWANLGMSLLGFAGVLAVLQPAGVPPLTITAAVVATVVGTVIGSAMIGLSAIPGAATGSPAMVLLRGLFGGVLSWVPSVLNVVQLIGWGTFELVVIAQAGQLAVGGPTWLWVVGAGVVTTLLTLRPLGMLRLLRRVMTILVAISVAYLAWWLFSRVSMEPGSAGFAGGQTSGPGGGSWSGFWTGADAAIAVAVSWIPVASDFSRHSRRTSTAFTAATVGYGLTQILCFVVGLAALALVAGNGDEVFAPMLAAPLGVVALLVLVVRETDQSFANVYSTAVSTQNLVPRADRRVLCLVIGALITVLALGVTIDDYASFLAVIGSVFVPLLGVGVGDALVRRGAPDLSRWARSRPLMVLAWVVGLVAYQLVNPGDAPGWSDAWTALRDALGLAPPTWLSASLLSFLVAGLVAAGCASLERRRRD